MSRKILALLFGFPFLENSEKPYDILRDLSGVFTGERPWRNRSFSAFLDESLSPLDPIIFMLYAFLIAHYPFLPSARVLHGHIAFIHPASGKPPVGVH
jgi:hypothetical protein